VEHTSLTLNVLLELTAHRPSDVVVLRHKPYEPALNRMLDRIVSERPELFDCYQGTHGARAEAALQRAKYVASFIRYRAGTGLFVGLYEMHGMRRLSVEECLARPHHRELMALGMSGFKATDQRDAVIEFDLRRTDWNADWIGRLIVAWPPPDRAWYRWAHRNEFEVQAITEESALAPPMPSWDALVVEWRELSLLPPTWQAALSQWRGIYLIIDQSDGKQYVGSAYGAENMLQRWLGYAASGHGGNKLLRTRNHTHFRFSILQRLSPDLDDATVIGIEGTWKERLNTRAPNGLNEN
jgi:hypothetical protein